ncbi:alanine racemase [Novosphingobium sp. FSY-8]|uniref:alanine racemase n=1 Tax=Novosphingobium ovatum TaxID=1908523 RepID=A0ABW9XCK7_9SPHN|nr:alanine racemase [Novosphingobium ovatum]NBC36268.1 alanine racemase [Novosphingobium ovatum]
MMPEAKLPDLPPATLRLDINRDALVGNWRALNALSGGSADRAAAGAAVKANAYGLGAVGVARALHGAGCRDFFVAHWAEAAELLPHVPAGGIAVLHGVLNPAEAAWAMATGVVPVINSVAQARVWRDAGGGRCHLMVDSGMTRLGVPRGDWADPAIAALEVDLLLSHLASADEDVAQNGAQLARWQAARGVIAHRRASLANSAGIALGGDYLGDLTRPGLGLYGGIARPELAPHIAQVLRPQAALLQVRDVAAGDALGYNATFVAPHAMRVGVVALGYADGFLRCWSGRGVLRDAAGAALPVLGRVSMDLTIVALDAASALREGDWLTLDYHLPLAAAQSGLSQYELLTLLGRRFLRLL